MTTRKTETRPMPIDERTVDNLVRLLAHERGVPVAEAARELLRGLAGWFGIDAAREFKQAAGGDES